MPSRRIWNQHAYHITNVNDDGSVPVKQADNWRSYNNFRMNVQGQGQSIPPRGDGTGKIGLPRRGRLHDAVSPVGSALQSRRGPTPARPALHVLSWRSATSRGAGAVRRDHRPARLCRRVREHHLRLEEPRATALRSVAAYR